MNPTTATHGDGHQEIVEAFSRVLGRQGYDTTTLDAVAEEAGIDREPLNRHFETKAELFLALHDHVGREFEDVVKDCAGSDEPISRMLTVLTGRLLERAEAHRVLFHIHVVERPRFELSLHEAIGKKLDSWTKALHQALDTIMSRGIRTGQFRHHHVDQLTIFYAGMLRAFFVAWLRSGGKGSARIWIPTMIDLFLEGAGKHSIDISR